MGVRSTLFGHDIKTFYLLTWSDALYDIHILYYLMGNITFLLQLCLEEEEVWRCALAWAKQRAGVTQPSPHWTEEERARVCHHLCPLMQHVRLLLIGECTMIKAVLSNSTICFRLNIIWDRYLSCKTIFLAYLVVLISWDNVLIIYTNFTKNSNFLLV